MREIDQIVVDTEALTIELRVARTLGTKEPKVWTFRHDFAGYYADIVQTEDSTSMSVVSNEAMGVQAIVFMHLPGGLGAMVTDTTVIAAGVGFHTWECKE